MAGVVDRPVVRRRFPCTPFTFGVTGREDAGAFPFGDGIEELVLGCGG